MIGITGDGSVVASPPERSAYKYSIRCNFQVLHTPYIALLVQMLQEHPDYLGFRDKIDHFSSVGREQVITSRFWDPLAKKIIVGIKVCITGN